MNKHYVYSLESQDDNGFTTIKHTIQDRNKTIGRINAIMSWSYEDLTDDVLKDAEEIDPRFYDGLNAIRAVLKKDADLRRKGQRHLAITDVYVEKDYRKQNVFMCLLEETLYFMSQYGDDDGIVVLRYLPPADINLNPVMEINEESSEAFREQAAHNKESLLSFGWNEIPESTAKYYNNYFCYKTSAKSLLKSIQGE